MRAGSFRCFAVSSNFRFFFNQMFFERPVKFFGHFSPSYFPFGYFVQLFLDMRSEINVYYFREMFHEYVVDDNSDFSWMVALVDFLHVSTVLYRRKRRRVS